MNYKERILEAWQFTQSNKKMIIWYGFLPAFITTVFGICYVGYQIMAFKASPLFDNAEKSFGYTLVTTIIDFIKANFSLTVPLIVTAVILVIVYLLVPVILECATIQVIARRKNGQHVNLVEGLQYGLLRFLQMLEYSTFMRTFSYVSISAEAAFIMRNLGMEAFNTFLPVLIVAMVVALILHILFTFTEYYIVIDEEGVMTSIFKSCTLVISNLQRTIMLVILMLIIGIRIFIQLVLVILIPAIVISGFAFFASTTLPYYAIYILGGSTFIFIIFASYLAAVVNIFAATVWTFTFLDFTKNTAPSAREQG
ncbi:hypothetical protein JW911_05170 [Candidatus Peregrinibacteria bacterium]|nr:hypothetical protein [Candidatus Peregrinibacteria bacterium]